MPQRLVESINEKIDIMKEAKLPPGVLVRTKHTICRLGLKNANNRVYEKKVWENVLNSKAFQEKMAKRQILGSMEHPSESQLKLNQDISHIISDVYIDENTNTVKAVFDVLPTDSGKFINVLLEGGVQLAVSTRADGSLIEALDEAGEKYYKVNPDDYSFITVDWTGDASCQDSHPENIIKAVESHYNAKDINKTLAVALLETVKTDASKKLIEAIKQDRQHESCKCAIGDKKCATCTHTDEKKEEKKVNEEPLLKAEIPVEEQIKIGSAVKVNEQTGIIAHIFNATKKAIVQYATTKEAVDLSKCKLVTEKKSNDWKAESELTENQKKHLSVFQPRFNKEKSVWEYKVDAQSLSKILEKKENRVVKESYGNASIEYDIDKGESKTSIINKIRSRYKDIGKNQADQIYNSVKNGKGKEADWSHHGKANEDVELEVNIDKQVEEFLKANRKEFKTDDEAKESLVKAFKITPEKAEEYVKKMVKGETPMDVEKKVVEAKSTDRWEITYVDSGKTVIMTTAQAQKKFGTAEFAEIAQGYAPHIAAINIDESVKKLDIGQEVEIPTGNAQLVYGIDGVDGEQFAVDREGTMLPIGTYVVVGDKKTDASHSGPWGNFSYLKVKKIDESKKEDYKDAYINEIISLSEGLREQEQIFSLIKEMFKLQKTFKKEDIIAALKDYIHEQEIVKNENKKLRENLAEKEAFLEQASGLIKAHKLTPAEVKKLEKELEEDEKRIKELEAEKEVMEKKNLELTEAHARELVKVYANTRIKVSGLKIPKQFNAILEACGDFEEVDRVITEIQDGIREGIINKANLSEIVVGVEKKVDPKQEKLSKQVANVFKGMGM